MTERQERHIRRLARNNVSNDGIAKATGLPVRAVAVYLVSQRREFAGRISRSMVTVKNPEAYLRDKGVWYGPKSVDTLPAGA